jgi:hypothetical protein
MSRAACALARAAAVSLMCAPPVRAFVVCAFRAGRVYAFRAAARTGRSPWIAPTDPVARRFRRPGRPGTQRGITGRASRPWSPVVSDGACSPLRCARRARNRVSRRAGSQAPVRCGGPANPNGHRAIGYLARAASGRSRRSRKRHRDPVRETARPKGGQRPRAVSRTVHGYTLPFHVRQLRADKETGFRHVSRPRGGPREGRKCRAFCGTAA